MGIEGEDAKATAKLLPIHPMFWPHTYVDTSVELLDNERMRFAIRPCPALEEDDGYTWFAQLGGDADRAIDAIVQAVDARDACHRTDTRGGEALAFEAVTDRADD